jgi:predicted ATPase
MLTSLAVKDFQAIPYLETSELLTRHKGKLKFSTTLPNVIVGPNGAGKTALMETLAFRFLAQLTGTSRLDGGFTSKGDGAALWTKADGWRDDWTFMKGLTVETDNAPARYYRPGHIPGNEVGIAHAMMTGYFDEAKAYGELVDQKSSGQKSQALLASLLDVLAGLNLPRTYGTHNWGYGREPRDLNRQQWTGPWEYQAEVLKALFANVDGGMPLVLMDEPEQSLDARAEMHLWNALSAVDCSNLQVIVATHSVYPLLHPEKFNIIEGTKGYARDVLKLMN